MSMTPHDKFTLYNLFGRGKIHMGIFAVPLVAVKHGIEFLKKKRSKKMGLRYSYWSYGSSANILTFDGSGTDFQSVMSNGFKAGSPVPEAVALLTICGLWSVDPGAVHVQVQDQDGNVICTLPDLPVTPGLDSARSIAGILTNIAGHSNLAILFSASNACTFTVADASSAGLLLWEE